MLLRTLAVFAAVAEVASANAPLFTRTTLVVLAGVSLPCDLLAGKPFFDDFSDMNIQDGAPVTWIPGLFPAATRDASSGDLVITNSGRSSTIVAGETYDHVSVRTHLRIDGPEGSDVGLAARGGGPTPADDAALYTTLNTSGEIGIWTHIRGMGVERAHAATGLDPTTTDVLLQFDVVGNRFSLTAWADGAEQPEPQVLWEDVDRVFPNRSGIVGIRQATSPSTQIAATFRYVDVVPLALSAGDYNGNGTVEQGDLDLVLLNWGAIAHPGMLTRMGWTNDFATRPTVDQDDLDRVLLNWGEEVAVPPLQSAGVPEPTAGMLCAVLLVFLLSAFRGAWSSMLGERVDF
jgi:hypothetical protein